MKPRKVLPTALALILVGLGCRTERTSKPSQAPVPVHLAQTSEGIGSGWVAATLTSTQRAMISTRIAATVTKVHVNEGQRVAAGTLLLSLSDSDLQGGLKAAEAALAAAEAHHRRIETLLKQGASTPSEQDMARTQLAQAQAALAQVKANLAYTQIRAPFAGIVQARRVNEGDFVGPGTPLIEVEGQGALELVGSVSESEAAHLKLGQRLTFEADGGKGEAILTALATGGDPISHRSTLRARVQKAEGNLRTGSFARIQIPGVAAKTDTQIRIPRSALIQRGELTGVFVARDGRAELRWISLGEPEGDLIPVRAGLKPGEAVIDRPGHLKDGQAIEVRS